MGIVYSHVTLEDGEFFRIGSETLSVADAYSIVDEGEKRYRLTYGGHGEMAANFYIVVKDVDLVEVWKDLKRKK